MSIELGRLVVDHVAEELKAADFHNGDTVHLDYHYVSKAEDKINRMTNVELLTQLGEALRWRRDGGDIGL